MQIQINTDHNIAGHESLGAHVRSEPRTASDVSTLGRLAARSK